MNVKQCMHLTLCPCRSVAFLVNPFMLNFPEEDHNFHYYFSYPLQKIVFYEMFPIFIIILVIPYKMLVFYERIPIFIITLASLTNISFSMINPSKKLVLLGVNYAVYYLYDLRA